MTRRVIQIQGEPFQLVATLEEGQTLHLLAGSQIAVEKMDMRPGGTEFDFQVHSRPTANGQPINISATEQSIENEFMERRVKTNILGLPISVGNAIAVARGADVALTYGELAPQVFASRVQTDPVAWRIVFRRAHYAGAGSRPSARVPRGQAASRAAPGAQARGAGSAAAGAITGGTSPGEASGTIGPVGIDATLRLYVPVRQLNRYRPLGRPFPGYDVIFRDPTLLERARGWLGL